MVYYRTEAELIAAYQHHVGIADYADPAHRPDGHAALQRVALQPGRSVLEVGAGSGRLIAAAKRAVGAGVCVAVDAVPGFVQRDIPWQLQRQGLTVAPTGTAAQQVHVLCGSVTNSAVFDRIQALPGVPPTFDHIFALHLLLTIPATERRPLLVRLRRLLAPAGHLVTTMSARFTNTLPLAAETHTPVQFRSTAHTEAPGSVVESTVVHNPQVAVPAGGTRPLKRVTTAYQVAPHRFWVEAAQQAREAADHAGFVVVSVHPLGKGDTFGLPQGGQSPSQQTVGHMTVPELATAALERTTAGTSSCVGRILEASCAAETPGWANLSPANRDLALVQYLQTLSARAAQAVSDTNANVAPGGNIVGRTLEHEQVSVMVVLRKV